MEKENIVPTENSPKTITDTEHSAKVLSTTKTGDAGGTEDQFIVDRYAQVKQKITTLQAEVRELNKGLQKLEEEAIDFAHDNRVSILYGRDFTLHVTEEEIIKYPSSTDPGRKELEALVRQTGIWDSVSGIHLTKLQKYLRENTCNKKLADVFSRMATRVKKTKISLVPRVGRY